MGGKKQENYVVVEGIFHDDLRSNYKVVCLDIPKDAGILNDGNYNLNLYGRINFGKVKKFQFPEKARLECRIDSLFPHIEMPRAIITKDGRIFINRTKISEKEYLKKLPLIIKTAKNIFDEYRRIF